MQAILLYKSTPRRTNDTTRDLRSRRIPSKPCSEVAPSVINTQPVDLLCPKRLHDGVKYILDFTAL